MYSRCSLSSLSTKTSTGNTTMMMMMMCTVRVIRLIPLVLLILIMSSLIAIKTNASSISSTTIITTATTRRRRKCAFVANNRIQLTPTTPITTTTITTTTMIHRRNIGTETTLELQLPVRQHKPIQNQLCLQQQQQQQHHHQVQHRRYSSLQSTSTASSEDSPLSDTVKDKETIESTSTTTIASSSVVDSINNLNVFQSILTRIGLISYIGAMCIALPLTLIPQLILYKLKITTKKQKEIWALRTAKFCSKWLLRFIPFCSISIITDKDKEDTTNKADTDTVPAKIWVCNHISMIDIFILLGIDKQLRGTNASKRPIKIVYWKTLENNPITKLLFTMAGFISVSMIPNAPGETNQYDTKSFKLLLKQCKESFSNGFDIAILPEGQLNPTPNNGLLPVFSGAYTLAKLSNRPIQMIGLYNLQQLWHPINGIVCTQRNIKVRCYNTYRTYSNSIDFITTFTNVIGHFCQYGTDLYNATQYLSGNYLVTTNNSTKE